MTKNNDNNDIFELLNRVDALLEEDSDASDAPQPLYPHGDKPVNMDATVIYRNAANHYGCASPEQPQKTKLPYQTLSSIRAYNADFRKDRPAWKTTYEESVAAPEDVPVSDPVEEENPKKEKKRRGCLTRILFFAAFIAALVLIFNLFVRPPRTDSPIGTRKPGTAAILLCGADLGAERTDTMMLLYVDSFKQQAGLLTLPRDTYTRTAYGLDVKLNSAYGRNGGGEEGMEVLLDYVQDIIGYRPDGYMLVELPVLRDLVDLMGGVDFNVPQDMTFDGIGVGENVSLSAGMQHLTGEQAMGLLRFRYGYYNQDLGRQDVQKDFLKACMDQWVTLSNVSKIPEALELLQSQSFTDLTTSNYLWFGWNLLRCGFSNITTETLPGYAAMIDGQSFYVLYPEEVADAIQQRYNPYWAEITVDDLNIVTE